MASFADGVRRNRPEQRKAVSEFRERRPDFSANRTCDAIAAVMGRVGV